MVTDFLAQQQRIPSSSSNLQPELAALEGKPGYAEAHIRERGKLNRATYKVELNIRPAKGNASLVTGRIALVRSGSDKHGGGDVAVFRCSRCKKLIQPEMVGPAYFACPSCNLVDDTEKISEGSVFAHLTKQRLAELVHEFWMAVGGDADIYLKRYKHSLSDAVEALKAKDYRRWELLRRLTKEKPEKVIYPLKNLMRDNLTGADMIKRFRQFLDA